MVFKTGAKHYFQYYKDDKIGHNAKQKSGAENPQLFSSLHHLLWFLYQYDYFLCAAKLQISLIVFSVSLTDVQEFVRYLYYEHRCERGKPRTVEMCLFYKKQGGKCL